MGTLDRAALGEVLSDRPQAALGALAEFSRSRQFAGVTTTCVTIDGKEEIVSIDPENGPVMIERDGQTSFAYVAYREAQYSGGGSGGHGNQKCWRYLTSTEQKVLVNVVAKRNRRMKEAAI
mmetsp:Transcript_6432/g.11768  ORF Transcript_6432/g.11768 Transcript_6432/m.11768 type:complete len:121 (+) Transcript_6432:38-400(+)